MKILHTVKYYEPSKGGMESVVKNIVEGVLNSSDDFFFTTYSNNHVPSYKKQINEDGKVKSIKEITPFLLKSQPLNIRYPTLRNLMIENDIIHHHYPFPNLELALLKNLDVLTQKKFIITWHANIKNSRWKWIGKYYNPIIQKLLNVAKHVVITSPQLLEYSDILNTYAEKVTVIPLSFDPGLTAIETHRTFPVDRKPNLLFVGKLRAYKGIVYLINAIRDLDVLLTIVGDGESKAEIERQVTGLNLSHKVNILSKVSNYELSRIYRDSDLFILPSVNEAEAFGVVQLEAMSNSIPVINTYLKSGVPFVSLDGVSGLTVQPGSSEALTDAIKEIINDKILYEKFSKNALERSVLFSREKMSQSYLKLYQS